MATSKIICPKCYGFGLVGEVDPSRCPQCNGTGTISVDDSQALATLNTSAASTGSAIVKTAAPIPPTAAVKVAAKNK